MTRQYINLTFTINVSTTAEDYLPADLEVTETITLQFPNVDPKYTVPPAKLVEGVTERVITEHRAKVRDYRDQQAQREKEERQRTLWEGHDLGGERVTITRDGDTLTIAPADPEPDSEPEQNDDNTPTGTSIDDITGDEQ